MKLSINVEGTTYVLVAAMSYITGGVLTTSKVIQMLVAPELFRHRHDNTALYAYEFSPLGRLVYFDDKKLVAITEACFWEPRDPPLRLVAGMVVPEEELQQLTKMMLELSPAIQALGSTKKLADWDIEAKLPRNVAQAIADNIPLIADPARLRKNGKGQRLDDVALATEMIMRAAAQNGIALDKDDMLGRKRDFIRIIKQINRAITNSTSVLEEDLAELGFRWRQGSKPRDLEPLLRLYELTVS